MGTEDTPLDLSLVRILLLATYELGRQPFGLASPAAWLRREGFDVTTVDTSRTSVDDAQIAAASLVAVHLQMHTATRLAEPLLARVRRVNPAAHICGYGLYAPLNESWLREQGVATVLGGEFEQALVTLAADLARGAGSPLRAAGRLLQGLDGQSGGSRVPKLRFIQPDRSGLPPLESYASVQMPDGTRRVSGSTEASRGCKHLCRHCPIVPVYQGEFRVVPVDVVMADVAAQVSAGAAHISFGDPDFLNGPAHAARVVERFAAEHAGVSYDVTIKIEHLLRHADLLPLLRRTGCLFVTSAVESVDDAVLAKLAKGHTRADFVQVVALCRDAGLPLSPTFVSFTPWTTVEGYLDLIDTIDALDLVEHVAPIQLAIRLLVTARSALLDLPDIRAAVEPFDARSLTWPWRHHDARVDALQRDVIRTVGEHVQDHRSEAFESIAALAARAAGGSPRLPRLGGPARMVPSVTEPWYCCAEPDPELI
jgi:radical SAM superfamily enzyme YgiQ (UPF0313 family)